MSLIVQKYGGSSVADASKILNVAGRIGATKDSGKQVVAVVSAMGNTTDELIGLAQTITPQPDPRELDLLLSTGELVSCTLLTMALRTLGYQAISLSGVQAGIRTDTTYGKARIHRVETERVRQELELGRLIVVAGFQGATEDLDVTTLGRGGSDTTAVALAAEQVGGAQICLDTAVQYAKDRVQFGRPIGSFQAIKHKCADMLLEVESAKSADC